MTGRARLAVVGFLVCIGVTAPTAASPQIAVGVGVGIGAPYPVVAGGYYYRPYGPWYGYGYPWYPIYSAPYRYPYPYPYPYPYAYPVYPYYDPFASLRLQVTPRETEVFVDGYFAGIVDSFDGTFQRLDLSPGEHELELYLPGHRPVRQKLLLQPGKTSRIRTTMQPLTPGEPEPARPVGQAAPAQTPTGNQSRSQAMTPSRGQGAPSRPAPAPAAPPTDTAVDANPAPPASATYGSLLLRVQPGGANILVDGERWEGPETDERLVLQVAAGKHVIEVQRDGYRRYTTEIDVKPGETTTLNVALTKQ